MMRSLIFGRPVQELDLVVYAALAGLFMATLGPFGTSAADIGTRLVYWIPLLLLTWPMMAAASARLARLDAVTGWTGKVPLHVASILLLAVPMTLLVSLWSSAIFQMHRPERLTGLYRNVVLFAGTLLLLELLRRSRRRPAPQSAAPVLPAMLAARLAPPLRDASLIALHAQDHYIQVFTSAGDQLVHGRLSDLVAAIPATQGLRVHRSWWVDHRAIARIHRAKGRTTLRLKSGLIVPVSRSFLPALREAAWL